MPYLFRPPLSQTARSAAGPLALVLLACALAGCYGSQPAQGPRVDPERAALDSIQARVDALYDSLAFYDGIDSGLYDREQRALRDEVERLRYEVAVCNDGGTTLTVLQVDELFAPSSAALTEEGATRLAELADLMLRSYARRRFRVEAHSDTTAVGASAQERYPSNWELSAARAGAIVRHLAGLPLLEPAQFELVSLGPTRPITSNETREGRSLNRRVRVVVLPEAPAPTEP